MLARWKLTEQEIFSLNLLRISFSFVRKGCPLLLLALNLLSLWISVSCLIGFNEGVVLISLS